MWHVSLTFRCGTFERCFVRIRDYLQHGRDLGIMGSGCDWVYFQLCASSRFSFRLSHGSGWRFEPGSWFWDEVIRS